MFSPDEAYRPAPEQHESASGPEPAAESVPEQRESAPSAQATGPAARILAHLDALEGLDSLALAEHADVYQGVHTELQSALAEVDGS
ncbi:MAG: hypothetical protein ABI301_06340 [Jatrophihabitantaceae bacterium]